MGVENFSLGMKVLGGYIQMPRGKIPWFYVLEPSNNLNEYFFCLDMIRLLSNQKTKKIYF